MTATALVPEIKIPLDSPESVHAAYAVLGRKPGASRKSITKTNRRLAFKNHPDRGGDASRLRAIVDAYAIVMRSIPEDPAPPKRGRPAKHFASSRWFIVDANTKKRITRKGKVTTITVSAPVPKWNGPSDEGYATRKDAEAAFHKFKNALSKVTSRRNGAPSNGAALITSDLRRRRSPDYKIIGPSGAERVKKHRAAKKARKVEEDLRQTPEYWNRLLAKSGLPANPPFCVTDAPTGKGLILTGGWDSNKIENVTAAHDSEQGGPEANVRRSRGGGFRSHGMIGNGPDAFDKLDESADSADTYLDSGLSNDSFDRLSWLEFNPSFCEGDSIDKLDGPSDEDREIPPVAGWTQPKLEYTEKDYRTGGYDEDADLEIEQLTVHMAAEGFSEFPELGGDDFTDILVEYDPEPRSTNEQPALPAAQDAVKLPATSQYKIEVCNEIALPTPAQELAE